MKTLTLGEIAAKLQLELIGDPDVVINQVGLIDQAKKGTICFLAEKKYLPFLKSTEASAVILRESEKEDCPIPCLISANPKLTYAHVLNCLHPIRTFNPGVHPTAIVAEGCEIDASATIGPHCVIEAYAKIGPHVVVGANSVIGENAVINAGTRLYPNVSVYSEVKIGKHCIIHSGAVIGSDGFGFANDRGAWVKIQQIGSVVIEDQVEIGANTTIDRGAIEDTVIGQGCILDNLIQIGHNVKVGQGCAIAACTVIGGSAVVGRYCLIGGASIINGHITIVDGVHLAGNSQVANDIKVPGAYASAITAREISKWKRNVARFHHLDELSHRVKKLENRMNESGATLKGDKL
ncbi:MAG: UDP-3-O-(3-hydroxymyristoyl)glucosamine N-acyltransferase [Gammaproteobacteria bacterium]